ncbi:MULTISPECIES: hypothetical protein [Edwardsiella]|uniref:hypothetical protein n=1 Tax=Edwardsiella TaxID=635 RepID=UPI000D51CB95|nr:MULTISPECIES: hypothetical protein [Edwardsiella]UCQ23086.1 hypothetical protein DCE91_09795 [Edwardsiella piscicida]WHQ15450.1 hypothetical protein MQ083_06705 [Edwardsiella anguillarum]
MLNHSDMTEAAEAIYHFLSPERWMSPSAMMRITGMTEARCQLILTQLVIAGLADDNGGKGMRFKRCRSATGTLL